MSIVTSVLSVLPTIGGIIDKLVPDRDLAARIKAEAEAAIRHNAHELDTAQITLNRREAAHKSLFVAGWRPFIGWVCGLGFTLLVFNGPINALWSLTGADAPISEPDPDVFVPIMLGMLGLLGSMRTYEKVKGVARER